MHRRSSGRENNDTSTTSNGPESKSTWDVIKTSLTQREARRKRTLASIQSSTVTVRPPCQNKSSRFFRSLVRLRVLEVDGRF